MGKKKILHRNFIFEADNEKGFKKLRDGQFSRVEQGVTFEPLANALDQQQGGEPVEVELAIDQQGCRLRFQDNGPGLTRENLEALFFIGKSTKKKNRKEYIGRFGMGLTAAFHSRLGVYRVEIVSRVCGQPSLITYDCSGEGIPVWHRRKLDHECSGFSITFFFPKHSIHRIQESLHELIDSSVLPILFNGKLRHFQPQTLAERKNAIFVRFPGEPEVFYSAHLKDSSESFARQDDLRIYLRGMLVEEGEMYRVFVSSSGDKMPQNYYNRPYMKQESCIVLSRDGEPTLGRDKLVRDTVFDTIRLAVEKARTEALLQLMKLGFAKNAANRTRIFATDMAIANLFTLQGYMKSFLRKEALAAEKSFLEPLLQELATLPLFEAFGTETLYSLNDILAAKPPEGVYLYAESEEADAFLRGHHDCPIVLKEHIYFWNMLWGGHEKKQIDAVLKPLVEAENGREMLLIDKLVHNENRLRELEKQGVLRLGTIKIRRLDNPPEALDTFMRRLKKVLNRSWFRESISRFHPPQKIRLLPVAVESGLGRDDLVAGVLNSDSDKDELKIGIHGGSRIIKVLMDSPVGEWAFLPILCHELTHRRYQMSEDDTGIPHDRNFYFDLVRMEKNVLSAAMRHLAGGQADNGADAHFDGELVVL